MLEITDLCAGYNGSRALDKLSLRVDEGEFVSIVGPNGAGKTTLFKTISGRVLAASGRILFDGALFNQQNRQLPPAAHLDDGLENLVGDSRCKAHRRFIQHQQSRR